MDAILVIDGYNRVFCIDVYLPDYATIRPIPSLIVGRSWFCIDVYLPDYATIRPIPSLIVGGLS